ncbi:hypothetical protein TNCV_79661 [Trichonephila clavipes]|nr:hypothetical protein TNCV_79661 [Trichonephila clavipes]
MPPDLDCVSSKAHEIPHGKGLDVRLSLAVALNTIQSRNPETMTRRKGLSPDEIANWFRELFENESDGSELLF